MGLARLAVPVLACMVTAGATVGEAVAVGAVKIFWFEVHPSWYHRGVWPHGLLIRFSLLKYYIWGLGFVHLPWCHSHLRKLLGVPLLRVCESGNGPAECHLVTVPHHVLARLGVDADPGPFVPLSVVGICQWLMGSLFEVAHLSKTDEPWAGCRPPFGALVGCQAISAAYSHIAHMCRMPHKPRHDGMSWRDLSANLLLQSQVQSA